MGRLLAFVSVLALAAAGGGWSPVSWGWATLLLCWAAALALVFGPRPVSRIELAFGGGLLAFAGFTGASAVWSRSVPSTVLEVERAVVYVAGVAAALLVFRRGDEDGVLAAAVVVCAWNLVTRVAGYDPHALGADARPIGYANGLGLFAAIGCLLAFRSRLTLPALAICGPALVLAGSAGSWLAVAAGGAVALRPRLAPLVAVAAVVAVLVGMQSHERGSYWSVALADARAHPALGSGAGAYHQVWIERRPRPNEVRDAHSLYLETLAELGPLGLALLAATLVLPFAVGRGPALGAYAAFVVQAGVDWEWELPAVTIAGLLCGVAVLRSAQADRIELDGRARAAGVAAAAVVAAFALVGLGGNRAIDAAEAALRRGDAPAAAAEARTARRWAPWSAEPDRIEAAARGGDAALLRRALAKDPNDWALWAGLADVTTGPEKTRAARRAARLNPLGVEAPSG